jgi:hypothetical protein
LLGRPAETIQASGGHYRQSLLFHGLAGLLVILLYQPVPDLYPQVYARVGNSQPLITTEYQLKAVYLYNFLHFVKWPEKSEQAGVTEPLVIGIVGMSPFGDALADIKASLPAAKQKEISIISYGPYRQGMDLSRCHLLFISASEQRHFPAIVAGLRGKSVLTVADHDSFLAAGGMINLVKYKGKVRWEINRTPVQQAGLRLNAKLMDTAINIVENTNTRNVSGKKDR